MKRYNGYTGIFLTLLMLLFQVFLFSKTVHAAPELILKFAGQSPPNHTASILMKDIAKEVAEKTKGRIEVKVYPANQLGDYTLIYEEQIRGTIDMSCISIPSQFDPRLELIYMHGLVRGYGDVQRTFNTNGWLFKKMDEMSARLGVKMLGFYFEGMVGTGTTKPANEPLNPKAPKGILVRVPNMDVHRFASEAMGYRTVSIPYSDVYQALQTGVCDGVNGFAVAAAYTMLGDAIKYWYNTSYCIESLNYMISLKTWNKLKPADQKIIEEVINRATARSIANAKAEDEKYMNLMRKKGIKVFSYTESELKPLADACASTWPKLEKNMTKELMDEFKKELSPK